MVRGNLGKKKELNLLCIYSAAWFFFALITGINPKNRLAWFLEAIVMVALIFILLLTQKKFRFSKLSYTLIFIYISMPLIAAHYSYENVPLDWFNNLFDTGRNYFDRIVHFSFGLLLAIPIREFFIRTTKIKNLWSYTVPVLILFGASAIYEIFEWAVMVYLPEKASFVFLAAQGDIWDSQKDMSLAGIGSIISAGLILLFNKFFKKDY